MDTSPGSSARQRWLARTALLAVAAGCLLPVVAAGPRGGVGLVLAVVAGLSAALAATWWALTHRGVARWLGTALAVASPVAAAVVVVRAGLLWVVILSVALWVAAGALGAAALREPRPDTGREARETPPPRHPVLIMNPRSGGGKVGRFDLVRKARALGAEVILLDGAGADIVELARRAVADGADLLGVAGGDGSQALVAGVAAEHDVPFMVISAGTRNHFALDLGLDRDDPSRSLEALTDGVEIRVDLGVVEGRTFVNNASFGAYAEIVRSDAYRDDKRRTTLEMLPDLLVRQRRGQLRVAADGTRISGPQAVLVSNNPYAWGDVAGLGRRPRLDGGVLGVLAITVDNAVQAAGLVRGLGARGLWGTTCHEVVVEGDGAAMLPVGVDGEALSLRAPVRCRIRPAALRVRVPRHRPGTREERPRLDWRRLRDLALPRRGTPGP